jgi:release factor glutamine methyltransferase
MTLQEARKLCLDTLATYYPPGEAGAISDWLLENISGLKKTEFLSNPAKELAAHQNGKIQSLLQRLAAYEPIQYVLNETWFCGLKFYVDNSVLIPRPETEELVEWVIANCKFPVHTLSILDIGTGSGCISIALKRRLGKAEVWACDLSEKALNVARLNAAKLGVTVNFQQLDFLSPAAAAMPRFDIIISNPPYIPWSEKRDMEENVTAFEPSMALFVPDEDPLLFYRAIAAFGKDHLAQEGVIYLELHEGTAKDVVALFEENDYVTETRKDMQGKTRMLKAVL